ncbi:hypothetical protein L9F63_012835, partial [Diploptera punctata]
MLWPGAVFPPELCRGVVTSLTERTGALTATLSRVAACSLPRPHRPKTQWYIKPA